MKTKTKNIFKKLAALCLGLTMTFGAISGISVKAQEADANETAPDIEMNFDSNTKRDGTGSSETGTNDSGTSLTLSHLTNTNTNTYKLNKVNYYFYNSGAAYVDTTSSTFSSSGVVIGKSGTIKFGTNNTIGSFSFAISGERYISSVTVGCYASSGSTFSLNNTSLKTSNTSVSEYSSGLLSEDTKTISFSKTTASHKAIYVKYFKIWLKAAHTHDSPLEQTAAVSATCTSDGSKAYYYCSGCEKYYSDSTATTEIGDATALATWLEDNTQNGGKIAALGHDYVHHAQVNAQVGVDGVKEYYSCSRCSVIFDADKQITTSADLVILALTQEHEHSWAVAWSNDENGHWHVCNGGDNCIEKNEYAEHTYSSDYAVTLDPTYTSVGSKHRFCDVCHYEDIVEIPILLDYVTSVVISGSMTKTSYLVGDAWNYGGLTVNKYMASNPDTPVAVTEGITWESSPASATTIGNQNVSITATVGDVKSEAKVVNVTVSGVPGTADKPYTVSEAVTLIDSFKGTSTKNNGKNVYVEGVIDSSVSTSSNKHTFNSLSDGTNTIKGYSLTNADITPVKYDFVVCKGYLIDYVSGSTHIKEVGYASGATSELVSKEAPVSVTYTGTPSVVNQNDGQQPDLSGLSFQLNYSNNKSFAIPSSAIEWNALSYGSEVTGTIRDLNVTVAEINVNEGKKLNSLSLSGSYPTTFDVGDYFNTTGLVVTANYDDESTKVVTSDAVISHEDLNMSSAGSYTITVEYTEKEKTVTETYDIQVVAVSTFGVDFSGSTSSILAMDGDFSLGNNEKVESKSGYAIIYESNYIESTPFSFDNTHSINLKIHCGTYGTVSDGKATLSISFIDANSKSIISGLSKSITPSTNKENGEYNIEIDTSSLANRYNPVILRITSASNSNASNGARFKDATITYLSSPTYTVTWKDTDNSVLLEEQVAYGLMPSHALPAKAADDNYTYSYAWDKEIVAITGNAEYKAVCTETPRTDISKQFDHLVDNAMTIDNSNVAFENASVVNGKAMVTANDAVLFTVTAVSGKVISSIDIDLDCDFTVYYKTAESLDWTELVEIKDNAVVKKTKSKSLINDNDVDLPEGTIAVQVMTLEENPIELRSLDVKTAAAPIELSISADIGFTYSGNTITRGQLQFTGSASSKDGVTECGFLMTTDTTLDPTTLTKADVEGKDVAGYKKFAKDSLVIGTTDLTKEVKVVYYIITADGIQFSTVMKESFNSLAQKTTVNGNDEAASVLAEYKKSL